jgi:hypothetical protein
MISLELESSTSKMIMSEIKQPIWQKQLKKSQFFSTKSIWFRKLKNIVIT